MLLGTSYVKVGTLVLIVCMVKVRPSFVDDAECMALASHFLLLLYSFSLQLGKFVFSITLSFQSLA